MHGGSVLFVRFLFFEVAGKFWARFVEDFTINSMIAGYPGLADRFYLIPIDFRALYIVANFYCVSGFCSFKEWEIQWSFSVSNWVITCVGFYWGFRVFCWEYGGL